MARRRKSARRRVGRVSYYCHHGAWWIYYREQGRVVRRRVADDEQHAAQLAAQINAQLATATPTLLAFEPIDIAILRRQFLEHHEHVRRSSLATISRYRAATQHLENFASDGGHHQLAHEISAAAFVKYLRSIEVAPNGHPNSTKRRLRDKGVQYIIEVCRSMYAFGAQHRHLPPYQSNPFAELQPERMTLEDRKPVYVFDEDAECAFLKSADDWSFPIHLLLAKTGLRPGELRHLLIEDVDLEGGWLHVRNKSALGWRIKTGHERSVPLIAEVVTVLRRLIGQRSAGPVFLRQKYQSEDAALAGADRDRLEQDCTARVRQLEDVTGRKLSRTEHARTARLIWRDAGAIRHEAIRKSFIRCARAAGLTTATCPKSWRHTFATLLQDANVDPLIRQVTLGHSSGRDAGSALGMTGVYTHTRPKTLKRQIEEALRQWPQSLALAAEWSERTVRQLH